MARARGVPASRTLGACPPPSRIRKGYPLIGRRGLTPELEKWARLWGAPYGRPLRYLIRSPAQRLRWARLVGPFAFQPDNNETRRFEYPWAYAAVTAEPVETLVEVGGSLAGLQFVLAREGIQVINVDPGNTAKRGWPVDQHTVARLNRAFRTDVELRSCFLQAAGFGEATVDCVLSISTLEHIPQDDLWSLIDEIARILRPGGRLVATVDLFLDLEPFSDRAENITGTNIDISELVRRSGLQVETGDPAELYGFPEFNPRAIMASLSEYRYGTRYPALAQAFVLRKPD